jgi:hypothetical protein
MRNRNVKERQSFLQAEGERDNAPLQRLPSCNTLIALGFVPPS